MTNHTILGLCILLGCLFTCFALPNCSPKHQQWLTALYRLGRDCGQRDALSGVTALPLPPCAVSNPLALRERAAPLTIPGAVQGKVGPAGSAGLGDISSRVNCCSLSCTMQHSPVLHYQILCHFEVAKQHWQKQPCFSSVSCHFT